MLYMLYSFEDELLYENNFCVGFVIIKCIVV